MYAAQKINCINYAFKWDAFQHFKLCLPSYVKSIFKSLNMVAESYTIIVDYFLQWTMSDAN